MARVSNRVKNYVSAKGKMHKMSLMDIYYKTVELRTVLCDIANQHKSWGTEWYNLVEMSIFDKAQFAVITHGKGEMVAHTVGLINELADLEATMKHIERGDD
jgi:hypothetical protein